MKVVQEKNISEGSNPSLSDVAIASTPIHMLDGTTKPYSFQRARTSDPLINSRKISLTYDRC
jgi:hypothetical protein